MQTKLESIELPLIKIVGVSASGKSTLVNALRQHGYQARPVSQEHSNVPDLWQQFERQRLLIYLDVDLATQQIRRPDVSWDKSWLHEEQNRLRNAHGHADLVINTSGLSADKVLQIALTFLQNEKIRHADSPLPELTATGRSALPKLTKDEITSSAEAPITADHKNRSNRTQRRLDKRTQKRKEREK